MQARLPQLQPRSQCRLPRARNYGAAGSRKLQRDRFAKRKTAAGEPLDSIDPEETRKRHITMAQRHRDKLNREKRAQAPRTMAEQARSVPPLGAIIILPPPAAPEPADEIYQDAEPAYVPPAGHPF